MDERTQLLRTTGPKTRKFLMFHWTADLILPRAGRACIWFAFSSQLDYCAGLNACPSALNAPL